MKRLLLTASLLLLGLTAQGQQALLTNTIYGQGANAGLIGKTATVTATLLYPNPYFINNLQIWQDPIPTISDTNGNYAFTNLQPGYYSGVVSGSPGVTFNFNVWTNTAGAVQIGSLITNQAAVFPSPGNNYYTMAQINALLANFSPAATGADTNLSNISLNGTNVIKAIAGVSSIGANTNLSNISSQATNVIISAVNLTLPNSLVTNDVINVEARNYLFAGGTNTISDPLTRYEVDQSVLEMKLGYGQPYWSNCVVFQTYQSRVGTNFTIVGTPPIWNGAITQNIDGILFNGMLTNYTALAPISNAWTVVVHYKYTVANIYQWIGRDSAGPIWILKDTNQLSETALLASVGAQLNNSLVSETNNAATMTVQELFAAYPDGAYYDNPKPAQSLYSAIVRSGSASTSTNWYYLNSVLGNFVGSVSNIPAVNTNLVNALIIGWESCNIGYKPVIAEIDSIAVFNTALTPVQIASAYRALSWLVPGNEFDVLIGDSRTSEQGYSYGGYNYFDDWPLMYYQNQNIKQYYNVAKAGLTARQATNYLSYGVLTNLPVRKYTESELSCALGLNDIYLNGATTGEVITNLNNILLPFKNLGYRIGFASIYDVAFSNSVFFYYSPAYLAQLQQLNLYFKTNNLCDDYWPFGEYVTQWMLNTNNPSFFTLDGVHFGYTQSNTAVPLHFAQLYRNRGKPWASLFSTNGYSYGQIDPTNLPFSNSYLMWDGTNWLFTGSTPYTTIYTNIAQMLASPLTNSCYVVSYYGIPDEANRQWGGGNFIYLANQAVLATNFGTLFTNSVSGGYWQRVVPNPSVNDLAWFGVQSCLTPVSESYVPFDCTLQVNNCITSTPPDGLIIVPQMCIQTAWVTITNRDHLTIEGASHTYGQNDWLNSSFCYNGLSQTNLFITIYNSGHIKIDGLTILGQAPIYQGTNVPLVMIDIDKLPTGGQTTTDDAIMNCYIASDTTNLPSWRGIRFSHSALANVEAMRVENCTFAGDSATTYSNSAAIEMGNNSNGFQEQFRHLNWEYVDYGIILSQGSFYLDGGNLTEHARIADFTLTNWTGPCVIENLRCEGPQQECIMCAGRGPVVFRGCTFDYGFSNTLPIIQVLWSPEGGQPQLSLYDNDGGPYNTGATLLNCTNWYDVNAAGSMLISKNNYWQHATEPGLGYSTFKTIDVCDVIAGGVQIIANSFPLNAIQQNNVNGAYGSNSYTWANTTGGTHGSNDLSFYTYNGARFTFDTNWNVIAGNYYGTGFVSQVGGSFTGNGVGLTNLPATSVTTNGSPGAATGMFLAFNGTSAQWSNAPSAGGSTANTIQTNAAGNVASQIGLTNNANILAGNGIAITNLYATNLVNWVTMSNAIIAAASGSAANSNTFTGKLNIGQVYDGQAGSTATNSFQGTNGNLSAFASAGTNFLLNLAGSPSGATGITNLYLYGYSLGSGTWQFNIRTNTTGLIISNGLGTVASFGTNAITFNTNTTINANLVVQGTFTNTGSTSLAGPTTNYGTLVVTGSINGNNATALTNFTSAIAAPYVINSTYSAGFGGTNFWIDPANGNLQSCYPTNNFYLQWTNSGSSTNFTRTVRLEIHNTNSSSMTIVSTNIYAYSSGQVGATNNWINVLLYDFAAGTNMGSVYQLR